MSEEAIRVVLVEDHQMVLDGLVAVLSADDRFEVVGAAASINEGHQVIGDRQPDVVVADYGCLMERAPSWWRQRRSRCSSSAA